ncbi:hypothetical protein BGZ83_005598 [Gryganskiella cystojenkinii]|nr:hypothetical protein BGZ83_005598 [Gryganskiella cystojenkinii]
MTNFSSFLTLAIAALFVVISSTTEAIPVGSPAKAPAPKPKTPTFAVYAKSNFKGSSKVLTSYSKCVNHGLKTIGSVHYTSGPKAQLKFYQNKDCKGAVTHEMSSDTWGQMGGPYPSLSVSVSK